MPLPSTCSDGPAEPYQVREALPSETYTAPYLAGQNNDVLYSRTLQYREFASLAKHAEVSSQNTCASLRSLPTYTLDSLTQAYENLEIPMVFVGMLLVRLWDS